MPQVPDVPLDGLYGDLIINHYRNPRHRRSVPDPDVEAEEFNPFCGDRVVVQLKLDDSGCVSQVSASTEGCSIIHASASMMAEALSGKTLDELEALAEHFRSMMQGRTPGDMAEGGLGDLESLKVVRQYPVRIKCALLPWTALEEGIDYYRSSQARDQ
ncbi:MAG: Fe-S cluster assembly sulfur transfer protein SufU [Chloroflexota bacterium]